MAAALLCSNPSSQLVHPGAVLCMLDLLPAISLDSSQLPGDQDDDDDQCWVVAHDKLSKDEGRMVPERDSEIGAGRGSDRNGVEIRIMGGTFLKWWLIRAKMLMVWLSLDSDCGGGDDGGVSVYVSCEGVEGCDNVVWMGEVKM